MSPELILKVDRFQSHSPEAVVCGNDPSHGRVLMAGNLKSIVCGMCGLNYPLTPEFLAAVEAFGK